MNQSHTVLILACLAGLVVSLKLEDVTLEEGTAYFDCFGIILCDLRNAYEFRNVWVELGPECKEKAFEWFHTIQDVDPVDELVFWDTYPDIECNKTAETQREEVKEFALAFTQYYEQKIVEIYNHYAAIGVCESVESYAKKKADKAQSAGGMFKNMAKPGKPFGG